MAKGEKVQGSYFFIAIIGALVSSIVLLIFVEKIELSLYVIGYIIFTLAVEKRKFRRGWMISSPCVKPPLLN